MPILRAVAVPNSAKFGRFSWCAVTCWCLGRRSILPVRHAAAESGAVPVPVGGVAEWFMAHAWKACGG